MAKQNSTRSSEPIRWHSSSSRHHGAATARVSPPSSRKLPSSCSPRASPWRQWTPTRPSTRTSQPSRKSRASPPSRSGTLSRAQAFPTRPADALNRPLWSTCSRRTDPSCLPSPASVRPTAASPTSSGWAPPLKQSTESLGLGKPT